MFSMIFCLILRFNLQFSFIVGALPSTSPCNHASTDPWLNHMHSVKVAHRDLKPSNVLLMGDAVYILLILLARKLKALQKVSFE